MGQANKMLAFAHVKTSVNRCVKFRKMCKAK